MVLTPKQLEDISDIIFLHLHKAQEHNFEMEISDLANLITYSIKQFAEKDFDYNKLK